MFHDLSIDYSDGHHRQQLRSSNRQAFGASPSQRDPWVFVCEPRLENLSFVSLTVFLTTAELYNIAAIRINSVSITPVCLAIGQAFTAWRTSSCMDLARDHLTAASTDARHSRTFFGPADSRGSLEQTSCSFYSP
jgi:hypothetical protein